jgi:hypothetical protein
VAAAAPRVLAESPRLPGRIDWAGAVSGCGGVALLVYGLSKAATGQDGVSHWGDAQVLASLAGSVLLLVSFVLIERRSSHPLLPMRVIGDRNRAGAYLIMLCVATGLFGLFFFLTLFMQTVLGYSAIRTGVAYLPFPAGVVIGSALASPLVPRIGPRPLILAGAAMVACGTFWLSKLTEHAGYASHLLGPQLVSSFGLGLVFVPLALVALHNVAGQDSGVASSLLNTAQQVGGAIGLALLGTVAWTTVADSVRTQVTAAAAGGLGQFNTAAGGLGQFNTAAGGLGQFNTAAGGPGLSNTAQAGRPLPKPGTPRLHPSTIMPWRSAFPAGSWLPRRSGCSPRSSGSPPSGSAART